MLIHTRILTGAALLFPLLATADTLIMKNGTRYLGNFNSANATQMSFTEYNGNRQVLNMHDVLELRFGNDSQQPQDTGFGRNTPSTAPNQPYPNQPYPNQPYPPQPTANNPYPSGVQPQQSYSPADDLDRLQSDLQSAMSNNDLSDDQRRSLQDSGSVLRAASQQVRNSRPMNQRAVRLALDGIRNAANTFQSQDRDILTEDLRRVSASVNAAPANGGRDY